MAKMININYINFVSYQFKQMSSKKSDFGKAKYENQLVQFRERSRKKDLSIRFSDLRNKIYDDLKEEQFKQSKNKQTPKINAFFQQLTLGSTSYNQKLDNLFSYCISYKFRYLSEDQITTLINHFLILNSHSTQNLQEIMKIIWLIGNWSYITSTRNVDLGVFIDAEIELISLNINTKLNHLILYNFTNICFENLIRFKMLTSSIIKKIMNIDVFQNKQSDISTFLFNLVCQMPNWYHITAQTLEEIIMFLKQSLFQSKHDELLRDDCILITTKMLIINQRKFYYEVVISLSDNIKYYIQSLDNAMNYNISEDIFQLMNCLYQVRENLPVKSGLFSEQMYAYIWSSTDEYLKIKFLEREMEKQERIKKKVWSFLSTFCKIKDSPTILLILNEFYSRCISGEIGDYEQRAIQILAQNFDTDSQQILEFWIGKILQNQSIQSTLCAILNKIYKYRLKQKRASLRKAIEQNDEFKEMLINLSKDERIEIAQRCTQILEIVENDQQIMKQQNDLFKDKPIEEIVQNKQSKQIVQDSNNTSNKSFTTISEALLIAQQPISSRHSEMKKQHF